MVEFQDFGWNVTTVSFLATLFFTILSVWGLKDQSKKICETRSGESVSNLWYIGLAGLFTASLIYGWSIQSLAVMCSGGFRLPHIIVILLALIQFKGFSYFDWTLFYCLFIGIIIMAITPYKEIMFSVISIGVVLPTAHQAWEIWRNRTSGSVSIKIIMIMILSSMFWVLYGWAINDMPVFIVSLLGMIIFIATAVLWFHFRKKN